MKAPEPVDAVVNAVPEHYQAAYHRYIDTVGDIATLTKWHAAIEELLAPPSGRAA